MPLYEYTCRGCGAEFEALVRGGAAPACPRCGGSDLEKHFSTFAMRSGSGEGGRSSGSSCAGCTASSCAGCR